MMELRVQRQRVVEHEVRGVGSVALATAGSSFEVCIRNDNRALYAVRLFVDGEEAEPGYFKKLRGDGDSTTFKGFICGREVHEFLFARSPVDERRDADASGSRPAHIGEVKALIYATRRVRIVHSESDSDDDEYHRGHRNLEMLGVRALPEKIAVKELGVQSRAGGAIERVSSSRRRRGDYRLEKIKPEVCELRLLYRDSFWLARPLRPVQMKREVCAAAALSGLRSRAAATAAAAAGWQQPRHGNSRVVTAFTTEIPKSNSSRHMPRQLRVLSTSAEGGSSSSVGARPLAKRRPGETARGPDGKRRRKTARPRQTMPKLSSCRTDNIVLRLI